MKHHFPTNSFYLMKTRAAEGMPQKFRANLILIRQGTSLSGISENSRSPIL